MNFKHVSSEKKDKMLIVLSGKLNETFNEFICELEKITKEKEKYSNYSFWKKPFKLSFEKDDTYNLKQFRKKMNRKEPVNETDLDYFLGRNYFSKTGGLIKYLELCKNKKINKIFKNISKEYLVKKREEEEYEELIEKSKNKKINPIAMKIIEDKVKGVI